MSLLPRLLLINDPIPALGKLVRPVEPEKVDAIAAFERGNHAITPAWVGFDMAVYGSDSCVAAEYSVVGKTVTIRNVPLTPPPPIAETKAFKVGDVVRPAWRDLFPSELPWVVTAVIKNYAHGGRTVTRIEHGGWSCEEDLILVPPKTEANGWVRCSDDMPDAPGGTYELRADHDGIVRGTEYTKKYSLHEMLVTPASRACRSYRLVKP